MLPVAEMPNEFHRQKYEMAIGITPQSRYLLCLPYFERVRSVIIPATGVGFGVPDMSHGDNHTRLIDAELFDLGQNDRK